MIEFVKDFIDELPHLSRLQIGLILAVIFLVYFVEYLIFYNSITFGAISLPMGIASAPTGLTPSTQSTKRHKKRSM